MRSTSLFGSMVSLFALIGITGCSSSPEPVSHAEITNEVTASAVVKAIDSATRKITLERSDGQQLTVVAGPEVRNFDHLAVGNTIQARYRESLSARRLAAEEKGTEPVAALAAGRAEKGATPGGGMGLGVAQTVRVESVDLAQHLVVFTDANGKLRTVRAERDQGKAFIAGLKPGDRVELVYGESVALTVE